jgi:hypothetical protein
MEHNQSNPAATTAEQTEKPPVAAGEAVQANAVTGAKPNKDKAAEEKIPLIIVVEKILIDVYSFRRNIVNNRLECKLSGETKFVQANEDSVNRYLQHMGLRHFSLSDIRSLFRSDFVPEFNPFEEKFKTMPKWDGKTDHIKKLAGYVTAEDQTFFETQLKKYMVRAIRCALNEGVPNRTVLVFYGGQDIGKSWYIRFLNPFGKEYYSESPLRGDNKDSWIKVTENFFINLEELADLSVTGVNRLKQFISIAWVKERRPYGVEEVALPRRCSFVASTNRPEFLIDTQNTRWLIIKISKIDHAYLKEFNIEQAWAQAYAHYLDPTFDCELNTAEQKQRDNINQEFEVVSPEHDAVVRYMMPCRKDDEGAQFLTKAEILDYLHKLTMLFMGERGDKGAREVMNPIKLNPFGVIQALTKEKFLGGKKYINGKQHRGYYAILIGTPKVTDHQTSLAFDDDDTAQPKQSKVEAQETVESKKVENTGYLPDFLGEL